MGMVRSPFKKKAALPEGGAAFSYFKYKKTYVVVHLISDDVWFFGESPFYYEPGGLI